MSEHHIGARADLTDGRRVLVEVGGVEVGVLEHEGTVYAYENRCVHQGGPVCEGVIIGRVEEVLDEAGLSRGGRFSTEQTHIVCPWHGFEFELTTGVCVADPRRRLRGFRVVEREGEVYVDVA
jgi:nitrite reductase/ring-hydroxylating ferredoxin subunit